ncbi:CzcE family metal-binding protein [Sulfuritalea sp.]|uniref:CzcE family metal-binding protein n=1 Tax=Sulfuritalea sp. TaxID=2480090 RepID=UPI00286D99D7|nr:CzcE family metal-binding protein [Sulfuritalea sp.]
MNIKQSLLSILLLSALVGAGTAGAADNHKEALTRGDLGFLAQGKADTTVRITPQTRYVNAEHTGTLKIENDKGQSFTWFFDTLTAPVSFSLKTIAPAGFDAGNVWVYVNHPVKHFTF